MGFNLGKTLGGFVKTLGHKTRALRGNLGVKLSHAATRTLSNVSRAAQVAGMSSNPAVKAMAGAVGAGANVGRNIIEAGKDIDIAGTGRAGGRAGMEKAKRRIPAIMMDAGDVGAGIATAAMFV